MLRLLNISSIQPTSITFTSSEIGDAGYTPYVVYDTSTGYTQLEDYYAWRTVTNTSTGMTGTSFVISASNLYPNSFYYTTPITDYSTLRPRLFSAVSFTEYYILKAVLDRLDLVRRRLPNPGAVIEDVDGMGNRGVVSVAGGYDKKFSVEELMRFIEGALIEINIHPPATNFYWRFTTSTGEALFNPYERESDTGIPYKFVDLIIQGTVLRALIAWGILEIDLNFVTSDSGLQITYDKVGHVASWMDRLLAEYQKQKELIKWDSVNSYGVGVGSMPYAATGIFGTALNMIQHSGIMPLTSMLGFNMRSNIPL